MPGGDGRGPMGFGPGGGRGMGRGGGAGRGGGRGRMGGNRPGSGPGGVCICPSCNVSVPHKVGVPCYEMACPKCGAKMMKG